MMIHFWNNGQFETFEAAKEAGALFTCDAPLSENEFDSWGWEGGILCDAMQAVYHALRAAGIPHSLVNATITDRGTVVGHWNEESDDA
jgi:hypothetical protein